MPYENVIIKKPYYDVDKFGSYVNYKSYERRKRLKKNISKLCAIFDICLIVGIFVLSLVLIFNLVKYSKNTPILIPFIPLYSVIKYKWLVG